MREHHTAPEGLAPAIGYSHVVVGSGRLVAIAGQVALDARGQLVGAGDPRAQTEQVFENLRLALRAVDASFADVIRFTFYCTDATMLAVVREVRDRYVDPARAPASTAVQVSGLFQSEFLIEAEALALLPEVRP